MKYLNEFNVKLRIFRKSTTNNELNDVKGLKVVRCWAMKKPYALTNLIVDLYCLIIYFFNFALKYAH